MIVSDFYPEPSLLRFRPPASAVVNSHASPPLNRNTPSAQGAVQDTKTEGQPSSVFPRHRLC